jgi:hypothetical protein
MRGVVEADQGLSIDERVERLQEQVAHLENVLRSAGAFLTMIGTNPWTEPRKEASTEN